MLLSDQCCKVIVKHFKFFTQGKYHELILLRVPEEIKLRLCDTIRERIKQLEEEYESLDDDVKRSREENERNNLEDDEYELLSNWCGRMEITFKRVLR